MLHSANKTLCFILSLLFLVISCDNTTGPDNRLDPPAVPEFADLTPSTDFFDNNSAAAKSDFKLTRNNIERLDDSVGSEEIAFEEASFQAMVASESVELVYLVLDLYFEDLENLDHDYEDETFVWEQTFDEEAYEEIFGVDLGGEWEEVTARIKAEPIDSGEEAEWKLFAVDEENSEDKLILEGTTDYEDANSGDIVVQDPENSTEDALSIQWVMDKDGNLTSNYVLEVGEQLGGTFEVEYEEDGSEHRLSLETSFEDEIPNGEIFWNEETNEGYIELESEDRRCWDENLEDASCE